MSIQVIDLTGHDTLLIRIPAVLSTAAKEKAASDMQKLFPGLKVAILDGGYKASILRNADATSALDITPDPGSNV